jgi:Domain of unknown function (DUF2760)
MISHGKRWKYAFRAFFSLIVYGRIAEDILAAIAPPTATASAPVPSVPAVAAESGDRAVQILALLLMEDLSTYPDAQIGKAVRDVHAGCRESLSRYITLAPVTDEEEGREMTIAPGTDPARVKVVGNVGAPPIRGVVRHRGWEAIRVDVPPLLSAGRTIVAPAEIEVA